MKRLRNNNILCTNCSRKGHDYKNCDEPITSLGIILLKFDGDLCNFNLNISNKTNIYMSGIRANDYKDIELFSKINCNVKFLMIRRKHTLGYIEFIRGRYKPDNVDGIIFLFQQMTKNEIDKIGKLTFDELWDDFWGNSNKKITLEQEFIKSKAQFNMLKNKETELDLLFYVYCVKPSWNEAEWGFPKGRRNKNESDLECAKREFEEETGFKSNDYEVVNNIEPLVEEFIGTNGINYRHIYYIAIAKTDKIPRIDENNMTQNIEIGGIDYFTYYDGVKLIRTHHIARKNLLTKLYNFILNHIIICINN